MAFSIISISSDSSEESVETSTTRVILFGTIPATIPSTTPTTDLPVIHDDTLLTPTIPIIPPVAPTIQYTSTFIDTDSSDSDTPDSPPPQDPYKAAVARWMSRLASHSSPLMTSNNITFIASFIQLIMEYLVKIRKKAHILELKQRNMKITDPDIQYAVSIKEDTVYLCLQFTKDHKGNKINTLYLGKTNTSYSRYRM
nr:hypothetical protein [Tanacetum cinerariifolium]